MDDLLDRQKDLIEVLISTISAQVKSGVVQRDPDADLALLGEEWGMSREQVVDSLVYTRLHLHNVMIQSNLNKDSADLVQMPLKMLASWLDEIPDVYDRVQNILSKSGTDGKGFVKVDMPAIVKECLGVEQAPQKIVHYGYLKDPQPI